MKTVSLLTVVLFLAVAGQAQLPPQRFPGLPPPALPPGAPPPAVAVKEPVNYLIRVEWKEPKGDLQFLEVLTSEGSFDLSTIQKNSVKINNTDVPITLHFNGTLTALNDNQGRLQLFLGRTVPYVTGSFNNSMGASASYSQMSVGLQSTFIVEFGKREVIQTDENGQISVLVKRMKD